MQGWKRLAWSVCYKREGDGVVPETDHQLSCHLSWTGFRLDMCGKHYSRGSRLEGFLFLGRMPASCIFAGFPLFVEMQCNPCLMQRDDLRISAFPCFHVYPLLHEKVRQHLSLCKTSSSFYRSRFERGQWVSLRFWMLGVVSGAGRARRGWLGNLVSRS